MEEFSWGNGWHLGLLITALMTQTHLHNGYYGKSAFIVFVVWSQLFGNPIIYFQVLLGQFCKSGPLGIWKAFPLLRGLGVLLTLVGFVSLTFHVAEKAVYLAYFYETISSLARTMSGADTSYVWTTCGHAWSSEHCSAEMFVRTNATADIPVETEDDAVLSTTHPAYDFHYYAFTEFISSPSAGSIVSSALTWAFIFGATSVGPRSLLAVVGVCYPLTLICSFILLGRCAAEPGAGEAIAAWLSGAAHHAADPGNHERAVRLVLEWSATWYFGSYLVLGKYAPAKTWTLGIVVASSVPILLYAFMDDATRAIVDARLHSLVAPPFPNAELQFNSHLLKTTFVLSSLESSHFWIVVYLLSRISAVFALLGFWAETLMTCLAEAVDVFGPRHRWPKSSLIAGVFCLSGFLINLALKFAHWLPEANRIHAYYTLDYMIRSVFQIVYYVFFYVLFTAVLPICLALLLSSPGQDLASFVSRQGGAFVRKSTLQNKSFWIFLALVYVFFLTFHYFFSLIVFDAISAQTGWGRKYDDPRFIITFATTAIVVLVFVIVTVGVGVYSRGKPRVGFLCPVFGWNESRAPLASDDVVDDDNGDDGGEGKVLLATELKPMGKVA